MEASPAQEPALEFRKLFWSARREHVHGGAKATDQGPAHQAALAFAKNHDLAVEGLLNASLHDMLDKDEEALKILDEAAAVIPTKLKGHAWFVQGSSFYGRKQYARSIAAYQKALDDPNYDGRGNALNNLGLAYRDDGDNDLAIETYQKALAELEYRSCGDAWYNLGLSYSEKENNDLAIEAYQNALADPDFNWRGDAWNNLGNCYAVNGDGDQAIASYQKALNESGYNTPAKAWTNLGSCYQSSGRADEALKAYEASLVAPDSMGLDHARATRLLSLLQAEVGKDALSKDDRALLKASSSTNEDNRLEEKLKAKIIEAGKTQYDRYFSKPIFDRDNVFSILRGWSSAVTLLEGTAGMWRGGGYFLKWRGYGLVIDPGFDFLRNFHDDDYHGREIDAVLVSHNHPDHNSDLKHLDDLRYELYLRRRKGTEQDVHPYMLVWDTDSARDIEFASTKADHRVDPLHYNIRLRGGIDLQQCERPLPFKVEAFGVRHTADVPNAVGFVLTLYHANGQEAARIGYTGDTEYFPELSNHLKNCDVLLAHISQPDSEELSDPKVRKERHLGYRGTAQLLQETKPRLALIGEFWAGLTDLRIDLVKGLRRLSGIDAVFPAGLGMHLELPTLGIQCSQCKGPTPFDKVRISPPALAFGSLSYLCPECLLDAKA